MGKILGRRRRGRGSEGCRAGGLRGRIERLEPRLVLATLVVNTAADENVPGSTLSLREAIEVSNGTLAFSALSPQEQAQVSGALSQPNTIDFDIPGSSVPIIEPTSALPAITAPVTIDGTSEPSFGRVAIIGLDAGSDVDGLTISAGSSTVKGLVIALFDGSGIVLTTAGGDVVSGCYLGTDASSDTGLGNAGDGVQIAGAPNDTIGGAVSGAGNIISGNQGNGIEILGAGATGNLVQGDLIGTDTTGLIALPNSGAGIAITNQAANNTIGGATTAAGNVISGNGQDGILINGAAAANVVQGNSIGTGPGGTSALTGVSNVLDGVTINGASDNLIGGAAPGQGNTITGNGMNGVNIFSSTDGTDTTGNVVMGNRIGTDVTGTISIGNLAAGVLISTAQDNTVGGTTAGAANVISANGTDGVELAAAAAGNEVEGNRIGTDLSGTEAVSNVADGVLITSASDNIIGGSAPGAGNVISGNFNSGVDLFGTLDNQVIGNLIGTDRTGTEVLPNIGPGIIVQAGAAHDTIGGTTPADRNIISANGGDGIMIKIATSIVVEGNYIGLDQSGTQPLENTDSGVSVDDSTGVTIGGVASGAGNVIASNGQDGISITDGSTNTVVQGNFLGTDVTGTQILSNFANGITVDDSSQTTIGGAAAAARNLIAANGGDGIKITDFSSGAVVQGNIIGTDITGTIKLANLGNGVEVTNESQDVTIGGASASEGNLISGNQGDGVVLALGTGVGNLVEGNFIGTDISGTQAIGNALYGVLVSQSEANVIGGATASATNAVSAEQNVISGNHLGGVFILGSFATGNVVEGNLIGTDVTGTVAVPNDQAGVSIGSGATGNTIGGTTIAARNVISGNLTDGVDIAGGATSGNTLEGNLIGTDATGLQPLGNFLRGVFIQDAPGNTVGGTTLAAVNVISGNGQDGIDIYNSNATGNVIELNAIGTDASGTRVVDAAGVRLGNGGNGIAIDGAPLNIVALNVISGNAGNGISVVNLLAAGEAPTIVGNIIGSDVSGTLALGNGGDGILLSGVTNETIGGLSAADRNVISANQQAGVEIQGADSTANFVLGNDLGTNSAGTAGLANAIGVNLNGAPGNTVAYNLISGNSLPQGGGIGVQVLGTGAADNLILGNFIGTDLTGSQAVPNDIGVFINDAPGNSIVLNVISGNIRSDTSGIGIEISGTDAAGNLVQSNKIGTDKTGTRTLVAAQADLGILLNGTPGKNTIGGTAAGDGNVISGFKVAIEIFAAQSQFNPTPGTTIEGNMIGTDVTGEVGLGNEVGIYINGVPRNMIGGTAPGAGNVISDNTIGIYLLGSTTTANQIEGNLIGLDAAGKRALGNYIGIYLDGASTNDIGGTAPGARNFIAGDKPNGTDGSTGIYLFDKALNNAIENNNIGTDASGRSGKGLGMGDYGVLLYNASNNTVPLSGKKRNRIVNSGIAALREFTGSTKSGTVAQPAARSAPARRPAPAPAGPRRLLRHR